jgi:4-amino-4-deoxy-L-arabinose transferase-like glycosyltransferase
MEILKAPRFDPGQFTYPPLTSYLIVAAAKVYSPIYRIAHGHGIRRDLPPDLEYHTELGDSYDLITPPEIIWLGRSVVAGLGVGIVILAGALGRRVAGARAGLFAMLFAALCPALVSRGSIAIIDVTAAFFAMLTLYFCMRLRDSASWRDALGCGIAAGLAFGGKYTVGIVFVAVVLTILALPRDAKLKALLGVAAIAGLIAGLFLGVPAAIFQPSKIVAELRAQAAFYQTIHSEQTYWGAAMSWLELGAPFVLAGIGGLGWMLFARTTRVVALTWFSFAILLLAILAWPTFQPFRNVLALVPLLCVGAAFFFEHIWLRFGGDAASYRQLFLRAALALFVLPLAWGSVSWIQARSSHTDSRVHAVDWLQRHSQSSGNVLAIRELAILPSEWARVPKVTVVPWFQATKALGEQRFDYLVTGDFDLRYATDPPRWSEYQERWLKLVSPMPEAAAFGVIPTPIVPYLWRTNDERIVIRKIPPR